VNLIIGNNKDLLADPTDIIGARLNNNIVYYKSTVLVLNSGVPVQTKYRLIGPVGKRILLRNITLQTSSTGFTPGGDGFINLPIYLQKGNALSGGGVMPVRVDNSLNSRSEVDVLENAVGTLVPAAMLQVYEKIFDIDTTGQELAQTFIQNIFAEGNFISVLPGVQLDMLLDPANTAVTGNISMNIFFTVQYLPL